MTTEQWQKSIEQYEKLIFTICYQMVHDYHEAQNLTQETFLKLIKYIGSYKDKGKMKSYLITIAINVCNTYFCENNITLEELESNKIYNKNNSSELEKIEEKNVIMQALDRLPEKQKEVIILKYYEDFKINDISKILNEKIKSL